MIRAGMSCRPFLFLSLVGFVRAVLGQDDSGGGKDDAEELAEVHAFVAEKPGDDGCDLMVLTQREKAMLEQNTPRKMIGYQTLRPM